MQFKIQRGCVTGPACQFDEIPVGGYFTLDRSAEWNWSFVGERCHKVSMDTFQYMNVTYPKTALYPEGVYRRSCLPVSVDFTAERDVENSGWDLI